MAIALSGLRLTRTCLLRPAPSHLRGPGSRRLAQAATAGATATMAPGKTLEELEIVNTFVSELPGETSGNNAPRQVFGCLWSQASPTPANGEASTVAYSHAACQELGLDPTECERPEFPLIMGGSAPLPKGRPFAQCYGGHQFGNWAGQLGDGRAINIGEVRVADGSSWELQLKGAGKTPYSRFADGRAVLRSSVREYVASEAFHYLGIPTTRALSLVATGDKVSRDMFYNGDVKYEPGAVVCRMAPSFIRFGTFQLPVSRGTDEKHLTVKTADYVIKHFYPHLEGDEKKYAKLLTEVVDRTSSLVAKWQLVGFVHGVLNTDNMSILGLTIDFGPYGFLDKFDPSWTPNLTDAQGRRYCYKEQVNAVQWNLAQLATSLMVCDLLEQDEAQAAVDAYATQFQGLYHSGMATKIGLTEYNEDLVTGLFTLMYKDEADFTNTFRALARIASDSADELPAQLRACLGIAEVTEEQAWIAWLRSWKVALRAQEMNDAERQALQDSVNPMYIPRQHLLQYSIVAAEKGDFSELETLMKVLEQPFTPQAGMEKYAQTPPPEMVKPGRLGSRARASSQSGHSTPRWREFLKPPNAIR